MKALLPVVAFFASTTSALAHDMWIAAPAFTVAVGEPVPVAFRVGHADEQDPWDASWDRIQSFRSSGPDGVEDLQAALVVPPRDDGLNANVLFRNAGTHVVALESYHAKSTLDAVKFNEYLETEGLDLAKKTRSAAGTSNMPGVEIYSRRAKMLVQVGEIRSANVLKPIGQTLEIVPATNPFGRGTDTALPVQLLLHGRPLAGAQIRVLPLGIKNGAVQKLRTDEQGRATFVVPNVGAWLVMAVHARPMTNNREAAFDTIFASMTFGFK